MNDLISKSKVLKWLEIQIADCSRQLKRELFAEDLVTVSESLDTLKKVYDNIKDMTPLQFTDSADKAEDYTKREIETATKNNRLTIRLNLAYAEIESLKQKYNEALKAQSKQKWISCKYELPQHLKDVFVCTKNGLVIEAYYDEESKEWTVTNNDSRITSITHWQPLPEPPKGE